MLTVPVSCTVSDELTVPEKGSAVNDSFRSAITRDVTEASFQTFGAEEQNTACNTPGSVKLIRGGKEYFSLLLRLIEEAKECIHIQTYIYDDDETGKQVGEALKNAVRRNVNVYLVADGYASRVMSQHFINELKEAGIQFRFFEPLFRSRHFYFGRRMHHKIVVADASRALVGGINISNRYNDMPGEMAWLDFALYTEGETARELCVLCWKAWRSFPAHMPATPCEERTIQAPGHSYWREKIMLRRNDWVRRKNQVSSSYIRMFGKARSHIRIMCSYFLPGRVIRRLLENAARRGVSITIVTAGFSDVRITKQAERWLYDWMLRNGIKLYEYQPTVLHAKMAACDSEWMTVGSYNVNNVSAYASIELNLDVHDADFTRGVEKTIDDIIARDCVMITEHQHKASKNLFKQFFRWVSYEMIRLIFFLVTFYYRQEKIR